MAHKELVKMGFFNLLNTQVSEQPPRKTANTKSPGNVLHRNPTLHTIVMNGAISNEFLLTVSRQHKFQHRD